MLIAINAVTLIWVIVTWVKSGFLAALNLWLFGVVAAFGTVAYLADAGRLVN